MVERVQRRVHVVVAGLGVMGTAVSWELARRGHRVFGMDAHSPPHPFGSSHGATRIIREAYFEHPSYVPIVQRAFERWAELERAAGTTLYCRTGGLNVGQVDGALLTGVLRSVREHGLAHEVLDARAMRTRFPALDPDPGWTGVLEPRAGALFAEECVESLWRASRALGATLVPNRQLLSWSNRAGGVRADTDGGPIDADRLVLALGPWLPESVDLPLDIERQTVFWFETNAPERHAAGAMPIVLWEHEPGAVAYAFPDLGDGVKAGIHHGGKETTARDVDRTVHAVDEARVREKLAAFLPGVAGPRRAASVCLYTNTPDMNFVIDMHPVADRVVIACACSCHGFKFAPALAEAVADLCEDRAPAFDLSAFRAGRFATQRAERR
jgi:sarcosine oxidase